MMRRVWGEHGGVEKEKKRKEMKNLCLMGEMCSGQGKRIKWLGHKKAGVQGRKKMVKF
jgi:hypothetical protein